MVGSDRWIASAHSLLNKELTHDAGDVLTVTFGGVLFSYVVPVAGAVTFNAALFIDGTSTLATALTAANVAASRAGDVVTFTDSDPSLAAGRFNLAGGIEEAGCYARYGQLLAHPARQYGMVGETL